MNRTTLSRAIAGALLASAILFTTVPAGAQPQGEHRHGVRAQQMTETDRAQMRERMQTRMNQRLDRMGARLEIKASQQEAWDAYRKARSAIFEARPERPARDADAATLLRFRADMAQRRAQHLSTVAEATAKLQQVLEPQQRQVLDEMARSTGTRGKRDGQRHGRRDGHRHGGERHGFGGGQV